MQTILLPIQAQLPTLLDASRGDTAWVITITLLVGAIFTPIAGKLGDMFGKRRIALVLLALLVAGSVLAAVTATVGPMIVGRGLQGMGMGVIPLGIAILRDVLPPKRLGSAIALVSATLGVGGALGLPISAFVTANYNWHLLFWVSAAIGTLSFVLFLLVIPVSTMRTGGRFDGVGALGLALGLGGVLLAVSKGNEWGWNSVQTLVPLIGGILVLALWGWYELRHENPLVDIRVSTRGAVLMTNLASIAMGFALFASSVVFPQLLQLPEKTGYGLGLSLLQASFVLMPSGLAMLAMSPVAGRLERRFGAKPLLVAGAAIIASSYLVAVFVDLEIWHVLIINTVIGVGIGLGYAAMPTLIMGAVPAHETGSANGLNTLMRSLGTSIAAAVVATVLAQSTVQYGGSAVPSADGFQVSLGLGLAAALVCAVIAVFIPKPKAHPAEHASIPEGTI
ncbi:EmrB/QacA subfamily drug resistance transporter [Leifsonia psychrotolerans]|uniref:EmrB/QacA subfamily drug resistance transporter n=2 Tax=Glaciibacter psychrotolerans TaxID=670054 RepID=A0A7Z0J552_9MICO|nr:EmrB/QacA subfamily drug resistance transporter [Leifsonia psychrotolerans]